MPIEPVDPSKRTGGNGNEKYNPNEKRGPGQFDEALERAKVEQAKEQARKLAEEHRAKVEAERPRTYTERLQDMGRLPRGGGAGTGGGSGGAELKSIMNPKSMKSGGKVRTASSRADGCAKRGKTKGRMV